MNNTKLVNVLRTFTKNEMKEFEKFVTSPFFNRGRNYLPFLKEMKKFYPLFDDDKMTPEYIHSKLYPGKQFNRQVIWNMSSSLLGLAEEYLVYVCLKKDRFEKTCHIADEYYERQLSGPYEDKLDEMEKELEKDGYSNIYFDGKSRVELRRSSLQFLEDKQQLSASHEVKKGEYSILYFMVTMSNVINNMYYNNLLYNTRYDINLPYTFINNLNLDEIIKYANSAGFKYSYLIEMYYCFIMTALKPEEISYFTRAKEIFEAHSDKFHKGEGENLISDLTNYCILKINSGNDYFSKMLFEVNKLHLTQIDAMRKKEIGKTFYIQVLRNALLIEETQWAKEFIEAYTPYLKHSYQKTMRAIADALLAFKLKDFETVLGKLSKVRFIDTRDKFYVKSLALRAYYELNELPTLVYQLDSAKQFVNKNPSLGKMTRENFSKFIRGLTRLLAVKEKNDLFGLQKLKSQIEGEKSIINHDWLMQKIGELETK